MIDRDDIKQLRAQEAQRLLDEPLLNEVLDTIRQQALAELLADTRVDNLVDMDIKRTILIERARAVDAVRQGLLSIKHAHTSAARSTFKAV